MSNNTFQRSSMEKKNKKTIDKKFNPWIVLKKF